MSKYEQAGTIGVDAGCVWIGDPCYIMGDDASHRVTSWSEFCSRMDHSKPTQEFPMGVLISSGYGDGEYSVEVLKNDEGRVAEVRVVFIGDEA